MKVHYNMTKAVIFGFLMTFALSKSMAQSPVGIWKILDEDDGEAKSLVKVYEENGKLSARVIKFLPGATITHCESCEDHRKGQSLLEMDIIHGMVKQGDKWDGGKILDPKRGKEYSCQISFKDDNTLKVRGYIGKPLFGKTHLWYRENSNNNLDE